ncbi:hypothetical protein O3P69_011229 [Scylla paramamosain]|uniref:Uncharacterized protein n=1 Tax=Scylla paramamosain TaxID=85552 RepID=A0AAW0SU79_SCYPA
MMQFASYVQPAQYILVGDIGWITSALRKTKPLYADAVLNAETEPFRRLQLWKTPRHSIDVKLELHQSEKNDSPRSEVQEFIFEGVRGILIYEDARSMQNRQVMVDNIETPGDGSSHLRLAAAGTAQRFDIFRQLWPAPPFDLMGRTLRINCLKVFIHR